MSTDYVTVPPLPFPKLKALRMRSIWPDPEQNPRVKSAVCLTDGKNYLWAICTKTGYTTFTRSGDNDPEPIIAALERRLRVRFVSEHEEEFDAAVDAIEQGRDRKGSLFYCVARTQEMLADREDRSILIRTFAGLLAKGEILADPLMKVLVEAEGALSELADALESKLQKVMGKPRRSSHAKRNAPQETPAQAMQRIIDAWEVAVRTEESKKVPPRKAKRSRGRPRKGQ